ncbi:MAG TPA: T9SS type A sorting domain-containing protein, partial [Bacteroidia bacterium]|nr:T9SS type A sorting domain-containing protein [Bacteroidia bacterium]
GFCGGGGGGCGGVGGFGGGGGGGNHYGGGGGGGGYSGGGGGTDPTHGGGGGSFSVGTAQNNTAGFQLGNGEVTITWNGAGCAAASRDSVTVTIDNIAPTAVCQAVTVNLDVNGNGSTTAAALDNGSTDNCAIDTMTISQSSFTCANSGVNNVTLTVTDINGNTSTCVSAVTVGAFPALNPTISAAGNVLTSVQTWATYQWILNGTNIPGANANTYTAIQNGVYSLFVTDANGCSAVSDTIHIVLEAISGQLGDWADLSIFPNPASGEFKLRTASPIGYGITLSVNDMYGRKLFAKSLPQLSNEVDFDISEIAAGTYVVEIVSEFGQRKLFRLVVQ